MNERIQKLEIETDAWCDANFPTNWTDRVDEFLPLWNKKFAELIVRECMNKTAGYLLEDEFGGSDVKEASEELAKHFRVKE